MTAIVGLSTALFCFVMIDIHLCIKLSIALREREALKAYALELREELFSYKLDHAVDDE